MLLLLVGSPLFSLVPLLPSFRPDITLPPPFCPLRCETTCAALRCIGPLFSGTASSGKHFDEEKIDAACHVLRHKVLSKCVLTYSP